MYAEDGYSFTYNSIICTNVEFFLINPLGGSIGISHKKTQEHTVIYIHTLTQYIHVHILTHIMQNTVTQVMIL